MTHGVGNLGMMLVYLAGSLKSPTVVRNICTYRSIEINHEYYVFYEGKKIGEEISHLGTC